MARRKLLQTNFSAGELSPEIAMRVDTDQYQNGAKSLANMRCLIAGGVTRRPGSLWLTELTGTRVVKFVVNQRPVAGVIAGRQKAVQNACAIRSD